MVQHGVLAEELELAAQGVFNEREVLDAEGAAADGVCFVVVFLATDTKRQAVDDPHARAQLLRLQVR